ncbi:hypothetical protein HDU96_009828 [Phlyctochytrium bullatum]|nr:hypothetical protein HDU96_009828 [Phlyctochytrium bullatum]
MHRQASTSSPNVSAASQTSSTSSRPSSPSSSRTVAKKDSPLRRRTSSIGVNRASSTSTSSSSSQTVSPSTSSSPLQKSALAAALTLIEFASNPTVAVMRCRGSLSPKTSGSGESREAPFPNEILLIIFELVPTSSLLTVRMASRAFRALVDVTLCERLRIQIVELGIKHTAAEESYRDTEKQKRPHLRHYRQFLRNITTNEITEATWYATPPEELKTVCECLCILKGSPSLPHRKSGSLPSAGSLPSLPSASTSQMPTTASPVTSPSSSSPSLTDPSGSIEETPMTWAQIKKIMTRYDFKTWLTNLRVGVDYIPFPNVKRVERIIMMDPNVTYERLREVSMAGYKLLIIVAACLQYCAISEDLRIRRRDMVALEKRLTRYRVFVDAASAPSPSSGASARSPDSAAAKKLMLNHLEASKRSPVLANTSSAFSDEATMTITSLSMADQPEEADIGEASNFETAHAIQWGGIDA